MTREQFIQEIIPISDKVFRLAFRFLHNRETAKDIVQSLYLKLWDKRQELKAVKNKEAFVMKITKNMCLDKIKLTKNNTNLLDYHKLIELSYDNTEAVQVIKRIIGNLPAQQKLIMELRDIEGYSFEEISELLHMTVNTIRVNLSIARKKVRNEYVKTYSYGLP